MKYGLTNMDDRVGELGNTGRALVLKGALLGFIGATATAIAPIQQAEAREASFSVNEISQINRIFINDHFFITPDNTEADVFNWFRRNRGVRNNAELYSAMDNRIMEKIQASVNNVGQENVERFMRHNSVSNISYLPKAVQEFQYNKLGDRNPAGILNQGIIDMITNSRQNTNQQYNQVPSAIMQSSINANAETNYLSDIQEKMNTSRNIIGEADWDFFLKYFDIDTPQDYLQVTQSIPASSSDNIIGPNALRYIYVNHYDKLSGSQINQLPEIIQIRLQTFKEIQQYGDTIMHPSGERIKVDHSSILNPFDKDAFYGQGFNGFIPGTYIVPELSGHPKIPSRSSFNGGDSVQFIRLSQHNTAVAIYENGILVGADYVSAGREGRSEALWGKQFSASSIRNYTHYASRKWNGHVMHNASWLMGGFFIHVGPRKPGGLDASDGCLRVSYVISEKIEEAIRNGSDVDISGL